MPRKAEKHHKNLRLGGGCNQTMEEDDSDGFAEQEPNSPAPEQQTPQETLRQTSTPHDDPHDDEEEDEDDDEEEQEEDFHLEGQLHSPGGSVQSLLSSSKLKNNGSITSSKPTSSKKSKGNKGNRCQICRKKVGLTGFTCRCGGLFCAIHRYSDKHECDFDYRKLGAEEIRKNNPVIEGEKIHKI